MSPAGRRSEAPVPGEPFTDTLPKRAHSHGLGFLHQADKPIDVDAFVVDAEPRDEHSKNTEIVVVHSFDRSEKQCVFDIRGGIAATLEVHADADHSRGKCFGGGSCGGMTFAGSVVSV